MNLKPLVGHKVSTSSVQRQSSQNVLIGRRLTAVALVTRVTIVANTLGATAPMIGWVGWCGLWGGFRLNGRGWLLLPGHSHLIGRCCCCRRCVDLSSGVVARASTIELGRSSVISLALSLSRRDRGSRGSSLFLASVFQRGLLPGLHSVFSVKTVP